MISNRRRVLIGLAIAALLGASARTWQPMRAIAHDDKGPEPAHKASQHVHAAVPAEYVSVTVSPALWADPAVLARGRTVYEEKCAVCHGARGAGDGPAAGGLPLKPPSLQDEAMVAEMTPAFWFWRVSEGGTAEPYKAKGSAMPAFKTILSADDRWSVIAYQHTLSGHTGPHVASAHPEMTHGAVRLHPEPRGAAFGSQWVARDHRWQPRGPWKWTVMRQLPQLYRELNGIDFGHAHLAETLLATQEPGRVEQARIDVLAFIFSGPSVPPDEEQIAPIFNRMAWEVAKTFDWTHIFHRSLYDLFASDKVGDKNAAYRKLLADYLEKPEAITPHRLDHHGALWSFPESKSFRDTFRMFNTQIWAYHWLQAAVYDVQLLGDLHVQQTLMPKVIAFYHGYLRRPPVEWQFMPMMPEAAPNFAKRFPEAAAIFDNLHMLHDDFDDILARPDLFPTLEAKRAAILKILPIYLNRNHAARDLYPDFHEPSGAGGHGHMVMGDIGPRPPSVHEALAGTAPASDRPQPGPGMPNADDKH
jgi:mono/diheme cytochrome c family protein